MQIEHKLLILAILILIVSNRIISGTYSALFSIWKLLLNPFKNVVLFWSLKIKFDIQLKLIDNKMIFRARKTFTTTFTCLHLKFMWASAWPLTSPRHLIAVDRIFSDCSFIVWESRWPTRTTLFSGLLAMVIKRVKENLPTEDVLSF